MKTNYKISFLKILIPVFAIAFTSCMQDQYEFDKLSSEMEINGGIITPIGYGTLTIDNLLSKMDSSTNDFINEYNDGLLYITYEDSIGSFAAADLISMPDQQFFEYFIESDVDIPPYPWDDTMKVERSEFFDFTFDHGERIDSIVLDAANLQIESSSSFLHEGQIIITCPTIKKNGIPFQDSVQISDATGTFSDISNFPLDGYTIEMDNTIDPDTSFLQVDFTLELYNSGNPVSSGDRVDINATIHNIDFSTAYGYLGNYELAGEQGSIELGFFDNIIDEEANEGIEFADPHFNINMTNSYGIPVQAVINTFKGYYVNNLSQNDTIDLTFNSGGDTLNIDYPILAEFGESKNDTISINGDNSNIGEFLGKLPTEIGYNISATTNPYGPGASYNFVKDNSKLDVELEVILPLEFKANILALEDTVELDLFDETDKLDMINNLSLVLAINNGIPLEINIQGTLIDSLNNEINTLFTPDNLPIIEGASIGVDGRVSQSVLKESSITYTKDEIDELKEVKYLIITARILTSDYSNSTMVKFYSDYSIDFNIGLDIDYNVNPDNL